MKIIDGWSKKVEPNNNAKANKNDGLPKVEHEVNGADKGEAEGLEIPQQPKDKAHCFCPILAKEHGENAAVILQGLGYKVARSRKVRDGRKWHYDTLEALEKRWPYLHDSGIHGIIAKLAVDGQVFKGCYNTAGFDPTTWYSVTDELVKRAMDEDGKVWFDVPAAVQCHSIIAGTIYQNIRFHLLVFLADHPEFNDVPFHKVNKAALARVLNRSLSTIKREFKELMKHKFITVNPQQPKEYTICSKADLVVPSGMKNDASKSGSAAEKNGSNTEMGIGSSMELTGSFMEQNGSFTERIGSYSDSNTHLKPFQRHIHKHHSPTAPPAVGGVSANAAGAAKNIVHHDIGKNSGSSTVSVKEDAVVAVNIPIMPHKALEGIQDIRRQKDKVMAHLTNSEVKAVIIERFGLAHWFITDKMDFAVLQSACESTDESAIISSIAPGIRTTAFDDGRAAGWSDEACELSFLGALESATAAFLIRRGKAKDLKMEFEDDWDNIQELREIIPEPTTVVEAPVDAKTDMLIDEIRKSNKHGWPTYSDGNVEFAVSASKAVKSAALTFFTDNPDLTADDVWRVMADCVEVFKLNDVPTGYDKLWKARKGIKPAFLFNYWEDIKAELDAADKLAS